LCAREASNPRHRIGDERKSLRPGTVGYAAAWKRTEDATAGVGSFVGATMPAKPVVRAAVGRVVRRR
jgi:hypothetical protein